MLPVVVVPPFPALGHSELKCGPPQFQHPLPSSGAVTATATNNDNDDGSLRGRLVQAQADTIDEKQGTPGSPTGANPGLKGPKPQGPSQGDGKPMSSGDRLSAQQTRWPEETLTWSYDQILLGQQVQLT